MSTEILLRKCHDRAGIDPETVLEPDSLIGFFQLFRPDGAAIGDLFDDLEEGDLLHDRLSRLYAIAGEDRRTSGGRDAYFLVRHPKPLDPDSASQLASRWITGLAALARMVESHQVAETLETAPTIRVLEGIPPKHPKNEAEKSRLLLAMEESAGLSEQIQASPYAETLRPAYYFIACDPMLRDYLMWPLYAEATGLDDPFLPYFELWTHGVKYRIFSESRIDLYLPRHNN